MTIEELRKTAHAVADAARGAVLPFFRSAGLTADNKLSDGAFDPVTEGDRATERAMRDVLAQMRPEDAVLGEEYGTQEGTSGLTWVLDPIDGTRAFVAGAPTWGVLIAVSDESGPIYGLIDQPYIGERFEGGFGRAKMRGPQGPRALKARGNAPLSQAAVFTTFPEVGTDAEGAAFRAVAR